jgi:hypothetical protein
MSRYSFEIFDKVLHRGATSGLVWYSQDRRWVDSGDDRWSERRFDKLSALPGHAKIFS